jgi:S1-C subfamily serine protease
VIVKLGSDDISSSDDLSAAVRRHQPGDKVGVVWQRGNQRQTATLTLGSRPTGSG